ncbi:MAG: hypothetical protein QXT01_05600 [Sulfolobales archaeon]
MVKELVEIDDDTYKYLESIARTLNVSPKDVLKAYISNLDLLGEVIENEVSILKGSTRLEGYDLANFIVGRCITTSLGLYGAILVLDELIGAWRRGFTFTHGSGKVVDELGNTRGLLIHLDNTWVSTERSLVSCVELLIHDEGVTITYHSTLRFEGFLKEEIAKVRGYVEGLLNGVRGRLSELLIKCDEGSEVDVGVEDGGTDLSIAITAYLKRFNCMPQLDVVDAELRKIVESIELTNM